MMEDILQSDQFTQRVNEIVAEYLRSNHSEPSQFSDWMRRVQVSISRAPLSSVKERVNSIETKVKLQQEPIEQPHGQTEDQEQPIEQQFRQMIEDLVDERCQEIEDEVAITFKKQIDDIRADYDKLLEAQLGQMELFEKLVNESTQKARDHTESSILGLQLQSTASIEEQMVQVRKQISEDIHRIEMYYSLFNTILRTQEQQLSINDLRQVMNKLQVCFEVFTQEQQEFVNHIEILHQAWKEKDEQTSETIQQIHDRLNLIWQGLDFLSTEYWKMKPPQDETTKTQSQPSNTKRKYLLF